MELEVIQCRYFVYIWSYCSPQVSSFRSKLRKIILKILVLHVTFVWTGFVVPTADQGAVVSRIEDPLTENNGYGIIGSKTADIKNYPYTVSIHMLRLKFIIRTFVLFDESLLQLRKSYKVRILFRDHSPNSAGPC